MFIRGLGWSDYAGETMMITIIAMMVIRMDIVVTMVMITLR